MIPKFSKIWKKGNNHNNANVESEERNNFQNRQAQNPWDLNSPLMAFNQQDIFTIGHSFEGVLILGRTGSGKTSGSGAYLAKSMLSLGYGGLILCAKNDEAELWHKYAMETGRGKSVLRFSPDEAWRFNFLEYEAQKTGAGMSQSHNLTELLMQIAEATNSSSSGAKNDGKMDFWMKAVRQLLNNAFDLLILSGEKITISNLRKLIHSAPQEGKDAESEQWQAKSYLYNLLQRAKRLHELTHDFYVVSDYWLKEYSTLGERTRASVLLTLNATIDPLNRGILHELFCTELNCNPEPICEGAIVIVDLSVKEWAEVGKIASIIWKYLYQRAVERRIKTANMRPVFLWADECQHFITSYDAVFQTTARSSHCSTVYLTQNLPNLYAELGGEATGKSRAESLLGNLSTKIFHRNDERITNDWASNIISKILIHRRNFSSGSSAGGNFLQPQYNQNSSGGYSEQMDFEVQPRSFLHLRSGGMENEKQVDAIIFQSGRKFSNGTVYLQTSFQQGI